LLELQAYHNSYQSYYREPFGAIVCGQKVRLRIEIESANPIADCTLRLWEKQQIEKLIPMYKSIPGEEKSESKEQGQAPKQEIDSAKNIRKLAFEAEYILPEEPGLVWYFFIFTMEGKSYYYGNNPEGLGGEGQLLEHEPPAYQITAYHMATVPDWYKNGIMYQIFVDRFYNGNENGKILNPKPKSLLHGNWYDTPLYIKDEKGRVDRWNFFGGNLKGVIQKLPYLQELGISVLYLNPIFEAVSNHKYDTGDYHKIDPMYGDSDIFAELVKKAEQRGISIILDGVFNHTGSDSLYFNRYGNYPGIGAFQSEESPYYSWYQLKECEGEYECWWGVDDLPNVKEMEPSYQDFIFRGEESVVKTWMRQGVKGWRLDVVDELPDAFVKGLRQAVKEMDSEAVLIGEVWEDASRKSSYGKLREYFWGEELDATMNYPLRNSLLDFMLGKTDAGVMVNQIMSLFENYPRENFRAAMNLIGSHDRARILTLLGEAPKEETLEEREKENYRLPPEGRKLAVQRLKLLALLQMTFPGVPCVYYGDEVGVEGYSDPYNRSTFPWGREDHQILTWYKRIMRLRNEYKILTEGNFWPFHWGQDIFGFRVTGEDEEIVVCINRNTQKAFPMALHFSRPTDEAFEQIALKDEVLVLDLLSGAKIQADEIQLQPLEGRIIYKKTKKRLRLDRNSGILLHLTSLPSPWGIGDMGQAARRFVDYLAASEQRLWQILPLNPLGEGHSPYQSCSVFAGNTLLISLDCLEEEGLLRQEEIKKEKTSIQGESLDPARVDYQLIQKHKESLLRQAFSRFQIRIEKDKEDLLVKEQNTKYLSWKNYSTFQEENRFWLEDYCLYMVLKAQTGGLPWYEWKRPVAMRDKETLRLLQEEYREQLAYHCFLQYTFYYQWQNLRQYSQEKGIKIIGDLPIYVAGDSCETWVYPEYFSLQPEGKPYAVAGVPPDYFSKTGQLWGNPLYKWERMEKDNFSWWKQRVRQTLNMVDYIRLDHFRGFEAYWEVEADQDTAVNGRWLKGPGKEFFAALQEEFGDLPFLAEDLGSLTPEVDNLKNIAGIPGMKVYQFSAAEWNGLENKLDNTLIYTGTHDNDTLLSWLTKSEGAGLSLQERQEACREIIMKLYRSDAPWVIIPLQDVLLLDHTARMNTPGTVEGNWKWRVREEELTANVSGWLKRISTENRRNNTANNSRAKTTDKGNPRHL